MSRDVPMHGCVACRGWCRCGSMSNGKGAWCLAKHECMSACCMDERLCCYLTGGSASQKEKALPQPVGPGTPSWLAEGAQYLPPIEKGNAFSRYLRSKREQHKGSRAA
eukprot:scaffold36654_cov19-Tisochrysis_lutea.AAC.2